MAHKSVEDTVSTEVSGFFDQAYRAYADTMKVAMKAQEDTIRFWGDVAGKVNPAQTMVTDWVPIAQKNADEYLRLLESSYRRNADLLKKVIRNQNDEEAVGVEKNARELWDASCQVANENARDMATTNLRIAQSWTELLKKGVQQKVGAIR